MACVCCSARFLRLNHVQKKTPSHMPPIQKKVWFYMMFDDGMSLKLGDSD